MTERLSPNEMVEPGGIEIRPLTEADLPALEWEGEYRQYRHVFRNAFEEARAGRRILLGAFDGEQAVGQVFIQLNSSDTRFANGCERGYLYSLRVRETYQGLGIGTRLIQAAEALLRERGYTTAVIAAAKDNRRARALYERLGFRVFMEDPGSWSYNDDRGRLHRISEPCWVMEKAL